MARRNGSASYGNGMYGQGAGSGGQDSRQGFDQQEQGWGQDSYGQQGGQGASGADPYGQGPYGQDPYAQSPYARQAVSSPYGQAGPSPYGQAGSSPYARQAGGAGRQRAGQVSGGYPVGSGRVYESTRGWQQAPGQQRGSAYQAAQGREGYAQGREGYAQNPAGSAPGGGFGSVAPGAAGVRPVSAREYRDALRRGGAGGGGTGGTGGGIGGGAAGTGGRGPRVSRRKAIGIAGAFAGAAVLGLAGAAWYTHRAVRCTVNGTQREAPVGSTAAQIVNRGYASPRAGNLVSICAEGENPEVLEVGGGEPYGLTVNGEPVNVASYRLAEGDDLVFNNGADVTEQVTVQNTEIPCGIQIPPDADYLSVIGYVSQWGRNGVSTVETGSVSGKIVDRGVTTQPQDLVIAHTGVNPADGRRLIAITFDDGPSLTYTPQYLDILARYGAKATFFNLGLNLEEGEEYVALCRRCAEEGHQVASHTYSHDDRTLSGFDEAGRNEEIAKGFQLVSEATGTPTEVMRPPYGEFRGYQFLQYLAHAGDIAYSAFWGVDSQDWELLGADHIISQCTVGLTADSYNGAVILMHDGGGDRSQDVAALPTLIETYQSYGYQLVTLNEMLQADPTFPEWVWSGYVTRPEWAVIPDITPYVG